ncbi:hypothetical protein [Actinophytocola xanthii]|uniref:Secreted protein n=1 Tax=Actinophytocola xanthii TaxID=1912961 RepID=A0A1Q8CTD2_9PSEU|nr:hypothetical protein [Actinophytocola xanthii]OLF17616.1 hypothetical protein BU204_10390 [Actinophytocola xanthii]
MFRRAGLALLAAISCLMTATTAASADPQPAPKCTGEVQLTGEIVANVCMSTAVGYDHKYHHGRVRIKNISGLPYEATLRVDVLDGNTTHYGNACVKTVASGEYHSCSSPTLLDGGPYRARARIQIPGYVEWIQSPA